MSLIAFSVNGTAREVEVDPGKRLSAVLREDLGLLGTKVGCNAGDCGACTVLVGGAVVNACLTPVAQVAGCDIKTIEGLHETRLQAAFLRFGAAQCGICTPAMLVAASALLAESPHPDPEEVRAALGGILCRCTGYAKIVKAVCRANDPLPAKAAPEAGAAIGAGVDRLDGVAKVTGEEMYGADDWPADVALVRALRSPHHRAGFSFGDIEGWRQAHPGVLTVLTAADIPGDNLFGTIPAFVDQPALADGHVRFKGEAVALIVVEPEATDAFDLRGFPVVWTPQKPILDVEAAQVPDAPQLHEDRKGNLLLAGKVRHGDVAARLAGSQFVASAKVETAYVEHAYIEPEAGLAWMDGDVLVIKACTQAPVMDQEATATILDLPIGRVRIIPSATGGGFGAKLDLSVQPLIGLAAIRTGRPCAMAFSRGESMASTTKRHPARMQARIGCDADGRITAMDFTGGFNTGAYASWGPTVANRVPVHASGPYRMQAYSSEARAIHTNGPSAGAFRGFGVPQAAIIQEILFDDLALASGIDRLEFRLGNAFRDGDKSQTGQVLEAVGIVECLEALRPRWLAAHKENAEFNTRNEKVKRGIGVASCWYGCGNTSLPNPSTIRAGITPKGKLVLHQGAMDIGQGANTVITQIFADALGVRLADISLIGPDTMLTPDGGKTSASRQTYVTGKAAELAGRALRGKILTRCNMGDGAQLSLQGGAVVAKESGHEARLDPHALSVDENGYAIAAEESYDPPTKPLDVNGQGIPYAVYGYGAQLAEVEVDMVLGKVKVRHIQAAHDVGRVINPILAEGQIEGGIAQGLGLALMEEYIPGRTENLHDYLIPTFGDMPEIKSHLIEKPDPEGPFGAKGLGEHVLIPTAPAILNAIRDATGARITQLPALPHRVLRAIREVQDV
ncbi:MAG: molybdopterin-dependent oxidoreductase [Rhodobacteraceae bacterium]|nr:molybdopterin-dependent oxidoreductase [Paracoccaceae bacterium]